MEQGAGSVWADECDLVLKGGITSGVVYPLAIAELAKAFRFRSIGGTSAGAIAAAAAAAAETGRQRREAGALPPGFDPFARLRELPAFLGEPAPEGRGTRLLGFFQPAPAMAPLFDAFLALLQHGKSKMRRMGEALAILWRSAGPGRWLWLLAGALPLVFLPLQLRSVVPALVLAAVAVLVPMGFVMVRSMRLALHELPANGFGICSGMPQREGLALTEWLAGYLDELSGQDKLHPGAPLTFGNLAGYDIELQVMTTCLTLGRPFRLPFRDDEQVRENNSFWFREEDFARLFPARVVQWLKDHQRVPVPGERDGDPAFLRLPEPKDLPVVVAVRMSLSFPLLLSAVPLHAFRTNGDPARARREPVWFTDGGIASNFPIHFFDAPLPSRPTFGIDLGEAHTEAEAGEFLPRTNKDARRPDWRAFEGAAPDRLLSFLLTTLGVGMAWNHEVLSHMPGFRDRIGLVRLTREQGGLNLTMEKERIAQLARYGENVGKRFVRRFGDPAKWDPEIAGLEPGPVLLDWENHQLIRFRLLLATMEEFCGQLEHVLSRLAGSRSDYERFLALPARRHSYGLQGLVEAPPLAPGSQAQLAREVLQRLRALAGVLQSATTLAGQEGRDIRLAKRAPRPAPELKVRPRV